ncbi:unnamed protein product, partial [Pylaiella littoralis]
GGSNLAIKNVFLVAFGPKTEFWNCAQSKTCKGYWPSRLPGKPAQVASNPFVNRGYTRGERWHGANAPAVSHFGVISDCCRHLDKVLTDSCRRVSGCPLLLSTHGTSLRYHLVGCGNVKQDSCSWRACSVRS